MKNILILTIMLLPLCSQAATEGWKNCDDEGTANCEYQISNGVLTIRPQNSSQPGSIPDYQRDCTMERYHACTTPSPWRWEEDASSIKTVNIESGINYVGTYAFEDMEFTTVNLPKTGLNSIGKGAFMENFALTYADLPNGLDNIGVSAFANTGLKNVVLPDGTEDNPLVIGDQAFRGGGVGGSERCVESLVVGEHTILSEKIFRYGNDSRVDLDSLQMYCAESNTQTCLDVLENCGATQAQIDKILNTYTQDSETGFYQTADGRIFATENLMSYGAACTNAENCRDILDAANSNKPFKVGSKIYNSLADFAANHYIIRRIYTVKEANEVSGKKNKVMIRYK